MTETCNMKASAERVGPEAADRIARLCAQYCSAFPGADCALGMLAERQACQRSDESLEDAVNRLVPAEPVIGDPDFEPRLDNSFHTMEATK